METQAFISYKRLGCDCFHILKNLSYMPGKQKQLGAVKQDTAR